MTEAESKAPKDEQQPKPRKKLPMTLILVVGVAVIEAGIFLVIMKSMGGGPQLAHGAEHGEVIQGEDPTESVETVEVNLLSGFRAPNRRGGRPMIFDMDVYLKVLATRRPEIEALIADRSGEIRDRIARVVRGADPEVLYEPELRTIRMQLRHAVSELAEDPELVQEVLIPRCVPMRGD